ncbi:MAG TPA: hypothetical protein VJT75_14770 [Thermoleophilaceae bacterium]|nr:hypothetical protein [Thermoleophilaceae bacterium]
MKRLTRLLVALLVAATGISAAGSVAFGAYSGQKPTWIYRQTADGMSDWFFNYDTQGIKDEDRGYKDRLRRHRDWPIMIIWRGEASKYRVKQGLRNLRNPNTNAQLTFSTRGHINYEPYQIRSDGKTNVRYNGSRGMKDDCGEYPNPANSPRDIHVRFYGESRKSQTEQRFYDPTGKDPSTGKDKGWNWFVVSSVHYDYGEDIHPERAPHICEGTTKWGGYSEKATDQLVDLLQRNTNDPFGPIKPNQYPTKNREGTKNNPRAPRPDNEGRPDGQAGNEAHIWQSDGLAHVITVNK